MSSDLHRPTIHFSPPANWMNDPCGLVFHNGLFHLYYQHNPRENRWGPMHWGHAVSRDLFHWRDRPVALEPDSTHGMAFTGSAVVVGPSAERSVNRATETVEPASAPPAAADSEAYAARSVPPLQAIYTGAVPQGSIQSTLQQQCLAVTTDGDRWKPAGVVLPNPGLPDFRDPKVGRHPGTGSWYLVLAAGDHVQFFSSPDLKSWTYESSFGHGLGYAEGEWECPDLFQLPLPQGGMRWVLVVHVGRGLSNRYAGAQYITGKFDGHQFHAAETDFRPVDHGHDFYAAQTWSGTTERRIWIAWASHWAHSDLPQTTGWAGTMTLPRELSLVRDSAGEVALRQQPVRELAAQTTDEISPTPPLTRADLRQAEAFLSWRVDPTLAYRMRATSSQRASYRLLLHFGISGTVTIERTATTLRVNRSTCDMGPFNAVVDTDKTVALAPLSDTGSGSGTAPGSLDVIVDRSILEIFVDDGAVVTTDLLFPRDGLSGIVCEVERDSPAVTCRVHSLKESIHR